MYKGIGTYMSRKIGILGVQVGLTADKHDNLMRAINLIEEACENYNKIDLVCMPELFYSNPTKENRGFIGEHLDSEFFYEFSDCAKRHHINIITGTYPLINGEKLCNTLLCINRSGELIGKYSKTHLFDAYALKESDAIDPGDSLGVFDFDFGRVGTAICYELRFSDYLRTLSLKDIDLLAVPAAFYTPRNDAWDILVSSAALGNLQYVLAVNQYSSQCFGRSCIVDPCGIMTAKASDKETTVYDLIDLKYQKEIREQVLTYKNRRPELYDLKTL